jgi:Xaa-Pro aminopeptidase
MEVNELIKRRMTLIEQLESESILICFAGVSIKSSYDQMYPFIVNRNFFYLTGIEQENSVLVIIKSGKNNTMYIFTDEHDELKKRWVGPRLEIDQVKKISGIDNVMLRKNFADKITDILSEGGAYGKINNVYLDLEPGLMIFNENVTNHDYKQKLSQTSNKLNIIDFNPLIVRQRMKKSIDEVNAIKTAIKITNHGLSTIASRMKANIYEYQLRGLFEFAIRDKYNADLAFDTIIASGNNATILHYPNPKDKIHEGSLVLCDVGAKYKGYSGDITRTYPVYSSFNPLQKEIYQIVLDANKHIISLVKPGLTLLDLQKECIKFLTEQCLNSGLIQTEEQIGKHYYHNVAHHLGLDTHDPCNRQMPLEPGNVITIEPGLYFDEYGIGIRIEDNVLVTEEGCENLSISIAKEISDIEKIRQ